MGTHFVVLDDGGLDVAEKMLGDAHEGQRGDVAVVDLEDALVFPLRFRKTTDGDSRGQNISLTWKRGAVRRTLSFAARCPS